jgi:hypothetical protein
MKNTTLPLHASSKRNPQVTKEVPFAFENHSSSNALAAKDAYVPYEHFEHLRHIIAPDNNEQVVMMITGCRLFVYCKAVDRVS